MAIDSIRNVAFEIDQYEMKHYNEYTKGEWEDAQSTIDRLWDMTADLGSKRADAIDTRDLAYKLEIQFSNLRTHLDELEHIGVQNGLIRSKHLHNFLQAVRNRDPRGDDTYHSPEVDHVEVRIPWYLVDNLMEQLYLKYHETRIHRCFDIISKYITDDRKEYEDWKGIHVWWKEIEEIFNEEINDEETISNHYHTHDDYWQYDIDPKECKNLREFFKKRYRARVKIQKDKEQALLEQAKIDQKKEEELKIIRAKEHKLRNYVSLHQYVKRIPGSVYWFVDKNKKFAKNKKLPFGVLYVGESKNFQNRFVAYAPKSSDRLTELERKMKKKFPNLKEEDIKQFIRDPKQCCLKEVKYNFLSNDYRRRYFEQRLIQTTRPLLNTTKVIHYGDKT